MKRHSHRRRRRSSPAARRLNVQLLETRRLLAGDVGPFFGVTPQDTGEFLLGRVAVTPVFFESNGAIDAESQDWDAAEIDAMLEKITTAVNWWSDLLDAQNTVHDLEFVIDDRYAREPVEVAYEAIDRTSNDINLPITSFLTPLGYADSSSVGEAVIRFNHDQRTRLNTDWAFTIFVADASDDPDGSFASGGPFSTAFAFAGGRYIVTPSTRPARTITHELGHIFYARDEYPGGGSWTDRRGYYNTQNVNAADNPTPGFVQQTSIMRAGQSVIDAYNGLVSPASTLAMLGWRDSDGDGVFDLADVPLAFDAIGTFDPATSTYRLVGHASAVPLINQNSWGFQSDISPNEISELQVRLDEGVWQTLTSPRVPELDIELEWEILEPFQSIAFRVVDTNTGMTSPILAGNRVTPVMSDAAIRGGLFVDRDADQDRIAEEPALAGAALTIRDADGNALAMGRYDPQQDDGGFVTGDQGGITLSVEGAPFDSVAGLFDVEVTPETTRRLLHAYHEVRQRWQADWSGNAKLWATLGETTGTVTVEVVGLEDSSFARIEAFDADGILIGRETTSALMLGETALLTIDDPHGRIHSVRMHGHAATSVGLGKVSYGQPSTLTTGADGVFKFDHLPDGEYRLFVRPANLIHRVAAEGVPVTVVDGVSSTRMVPVSIVDSPRHNTELAADVDGLDGATAFDALLIINDLNRNGDRLLAGEEATGPSIDVNNDGMVTAIDALLVINHLNRRSDSNPGEGEAAGVVVPGVVVPPAGGPGPAAGIASAAADPVPADQGDALRENHESSVPATIFRNSTLARADRDADSAEQRDRNEVIDEFFSALPTASFSDEGLSDSRNFPG